MAEVGGWEARSAEPEVNQHQLRLNLNPKPPFANDEKFLEQIEKYIYPSHYFPYVQLQLLASIPVKNVTEKVSPFQVKENKTGRASGSGSFQCPVCKRNFGSQFKLNHHLSTYHRHEVEKPYFCPTCLAQFKEYLHFKSHLFSAHPKEYRIRNLPSRQNQNKQKIIYLCHSCPLCPKRFGSQRDLSLHITTHNDIQRTSQSRYQKYTSRFNVNVKASSSLVNLESSHPIKCSLCSQRFTIDYYLELHLKKTHKVAKPFTCSICSSFFGSNEERKSHLLDKHPNDFQFQERKLTKSKHRNSGPKKMILAAVLKYSCPECPKKFPYESNLTHHLSSHNKDKLLVCRTCGSKFKRNFSLTNHLAENKCQTVLDQIAARQCRCEHCGVAYKSPKTLRVHIREIHGIENRAKFLPKSSHVCQVCGYNAPNSYCLEGHSRTHTGEKPFGCKGCGSRFGNRSNLYSHIRTCKRADEEQLQRLPPKKDRPIYNEKRPGDLPKGPYKCYYCDMNFSKKLLRQNHEMTHGHRFGCSHCHTSFNSTHALSMHKKAFHPEVPFTFICSSCGSEYSTAFERDKHVKAVHKLNTAKGTPRPRPGSKKNGTRPVVEPIYIDIATKIRPQPSKPIIQGRSDPVLKNDTEDPLGT